MGIHANSQVSRDAAKKGRARRFRPGAPQYSSSTVAGKASPAVAFIIDTVSLCYRPSKTTTTNTFSSSEMI
jgi:hypothetical protein